MCQPCPFAWEIRNFYGWNSFTPSAPNWMGLSRDVSVHSFVFSWTPDSITPSAERRGPSFFSVHHPPVWYGFPYISPSPLHCLNSRRKVIYPNYTLEFWNCNMSIYICFSSISMIFIPFRDTCSLMLLQRRKSIFFPWFQTSVLL